jgi:hypothetical protein
MMEQHVCHTVQVGLDVLPCGPRRPNPAEMLSSARLADLLAWAETRYDQILVDAPPVLAASDALIVGRLVDGAVLVVQPEKNRRKLVTRAVESFQVVGIPIVGAVANRVGQDGSKDYAYTYGYGYAYEYGESDSSEEELEDASLEEEVDNIDGYEDDFVEGAENGDDNELVDDDRGTTEDEFATPADEEHLSADEEPYGDDAYGDEYDDDEDDTEYRRAA